MIHNLPEAINGEEEVKNVSRLLHEILPNCERIEFECDQEQANKRQTGQYEGVFFVGKVTADH